MPGCEKCSKEIPVARYLELKYHRRCPECYEKYRKRSRLKAILGVIIVGAILIACIIVEQKILNGLII
ncbi:MAG: hypothetical protein ACFFCS_23540 [Candidatus Hodarchaeota archaeon]